MENNNETGKPSSLGIGCGALLIILFILAILLPANENNQTMVSTWEDNKTITQVKPIAKPTEKTKANESTLNDNMVNLVKQGKLTSDRLTKADMAYWAVDTYGFDCDEVKSVKNIPGKRIYLTDNDLDIASNIINSKNFAYQEVTCTSGLKLRFFKRENYYPYIIEN